MRKLFEYKVKLSSIKLDKEGIGKKIGCDFVGEADSLLHHFANVEAKGAFLIIEPSESNFCFGKKVDSVFLKAQKIALFLTSLGDTSLSIINSSKADPLAYYLSDFLASQYADLMAEYMHDRVKDYATSASYCFSNRYSPGYCGWNVREQKKLFGFFPENPCGIRLTESFLMDPVKSVSGAVALGSDVIYQDYGCKMCKEINCLYKSKL